MRKQFSLKDSLLASTIIGSALALAAPAFAQTPANPPVTNDRTPPPIETNAAPGVAAVASADDAETIVVTGSRIARPDLISASPVQVIGALDIDNSGTPNIQSLLLENPTFGTPGISRTNSNFSTSSAGVATVDLRNLGSDRTLVLVDGRRFVAGVPGSASVDLNNIPAQFIEQVEILTGGASAIYGSDAVAGVVNIKYKKNFQGVEIGGQVGVSERGDDSQRQLNLTIGGNFDDNKGNVIAYVGYTREGAVFSRDRERSAVDQFSRALTAQAAGDDSDIFTAQRPFFSGFNPRGTLFIRPGVAGLNLNPGTGAGQDTDFTDPGEFAPIAALTRTYDPVTGQLVPANTNGAVGVNATGFNRSAFRTIAIPTERYLFATRANYEIDEAFNVFLEGTYASTQVTTELEPFPLDSAGPNGIFPASGGRFPIEGLFTNPTTGVTSLSRNPLVPIAIFNQAIDTPTRDTNGNGVIDAGDVATGGDGLRDLAFTRRLSDFGNRGSRVDRDTFRLVAGANGKISDDWTYEAYYTYGQTKEAQENNGQVNVLNFRNALDVVTDQFGQAICRDAQARAQGCVPADVFSGEGRISAASSAYITAPSSLTSFTSQSVAAANVAGSLVDLPAGPLGVSFGVEYRREASRQTFDALTNAGLNGGNRLANTEGKFNVKEGFAEVVIPILKDQPFFNMLTVSGAGRVSDYSTTGTSYSYNGSIEWAPVADLRFRATYARSTRAPNIGELFGGASQDFPTGLQDPCEGITAASTGTLATQCRSFPGVSANIAANGGVFTLNQADVQGVSGLNTSNPNLDVEKGTSYIIGGVFNPSFLKNFSLTVDYFNIDIEDAIVGVPRQFILDQCFEQANNALCQFITRRPGVAGANSAGSLDFVNQTINNSGGLKTTGLDVVGAYRQDLSAIGLGGTVNLRVAWTHVFKAYVIPLPGEEQDSSNNEIGASKDKVFGTIDYSLGDVGFTVRGNYIGPAYLDDQFTGIRAGEDGSDVYRVKARFNADLQVRFTPGDNYEFYLGVNNVLDTEPAPIISGLPGNTTGAETAADVYDAIGRRFYAGARVKF